MILQNKFSHFTAKERKYLSYPARFLQNEKLLIGEVLDFGCGLGKDVEILLKNGLNIIGYDSYYKPIYPVQKFDTILCFYVLNVLLPEEQTTVLMEISELLKPGGTAYFAVRRDIQHEGFRLHKVHQQPTYQCNVRLDYKSILKNEHCEIYEYKHFNRIDRTNENNCPFCNPAIDMELIVESATAFSIYDKFPVNNGHALIIPKRHIANYFELSFKEQSACWFVINKVKEIVQKKYAPSGFNIGINIKESAGQTVPHVHIHLIPRYEGDVEKPRGGVRGVIPSRQSY